MTDMSILPLRLLPQLSDRPVRPLNAIYGEAMTARESELGSVPPVPETSIKLPEVPDAQEVLNLLSDLMGQFQQWQVESGQQCQQIRNDGPQSSPRRGEIISRRSDYRASKNPDFTPLLKSCVR